MVHLDFKTAIWRFEQHQSPVHYHSGMGECAVCKAKRLQEESEIEFRKRYPMKVLRQR